MTSDFDDSPGVIVIADDATAAAAANAAIEQAGARIVATVRWAEALDRVAAQITPAILLVEAAAVPEDVIERTLPALVAAAGAARVVVAFGADRLDQVAAALIGSEAALLCEPTVIDRVAALVMAGRSDALDVRDSREEAARLARINAEVARFTETLARLTGAPQGPDASTDRPAIVGDRRTDFGQPVADAVDLRAVAADLRRAIRARRMRDEMFGMPGLFEDPAWDMLLDLYAAELERRQVSVSSLCIAAAVAPTTALRWINKLIAAGLFERRPDSLDRRRAFVALAARGSTAMRDYLAALGRAGLTIA